MKLALLLLTAPLWASTITVTPEPNAAAGIAAQGPLTVSASFDSTPLGTYSSLGTPVGTFSVAPGSLAGCCSPSTLTDQFSVLNAAHSKFKGRYAIDGTWWLDSNDITRLLLTTTDQTLSFFLTDVGDVGGTLTLSMGDGTAFSFPAGANGNLYLVTVAGIDGSLLFSNSSRNDGWGLDRIGVPASVVPEPRLLVVLLGALIVGLAWRRSKARKASS